MVSILFSSVLLCKNSFLQHNIHLCSQCGISFTPPIILSTQRLFVKEILENSVSRCAIVCDNLSKVYQGVDGTTEKHAVVGLSISVPHGQCFGMLGPNGAGKTSCIHMVWSLVACSPISSSCLSCANMLEMIMGITTH